MANNHRFWKPIFLWLPTDWGTSAIGVLLIFLISSLLWEVKRYHLGAKEFLRTAITTWKSWVRKQGKVILTEVCSSALRKLLFKYSGICFQTSLGHRSLMHLNRHKALILQRFMCSCHCTGAYIDLLHIYKVKYCSKSATHSVIVKAINVLHYTILLLG